MAWEGRYKLVRGFDPAASRPNLNRPYAEAGESLPPLLFDLHDDPWEDRNIAPDRPAVVRRLEEVLT